jgi:hypothetical protein
MTLQPQMIMISLGVWPSGGSSPRVARPQTLHVHKSIGFSSSESLVLGCTSEWVPVSYRRIHVGYRRAPGRWTLRSVEWDWARSGNALGRCCQDVTIYCKSSDQVHTTIGFWSRLPAGVEPGAKVNPFVTQIIDRILATNPAYRSGSSSAIRDLLLLVSCKPILTIIPS